MGSADGNAMLITEATEEVKRFSAMTSGNSDDKGTVTVLITIY